MNVRPAAFGPLLALALLAAPLMSVSPAAGSASDTDGDGLPNTWERYRSLTSPTRADTDRDGVPDGREDPDHDGLTNRQEYGAGLNPRRADTDGDGIRDDREDNDHDGLRTSFEFLAGTHPLRLDTDGNGRADGREDPDHDGLTNRTEQTLGTQPRRADTDGDGYTDGAEVAAGTNPRLASSHPKPAPSPTPSPTPPPTPVPTPTPIPTPTPTPVPSPTPPASGGSPTLPGAPGCPVLPADNVWNVPVAGLSVAANSSTMIGTIGLTRGLHMDFGSFAGYGIPYNVVGSATARSSVTFDYADESDQVGYPIPASPLIEGGSDRHILMVDRDACRLFELYDARQSTSGAWSAGSGATWDLRSNALRSDGWTSADAAGLPILPGLVRYDEVAAGAINHALRFTTNVTQKAYIYPARHYASSDTSASLPPMGLRVRLKASYNTAGLSPQARVIAEALKQYGMILADNGSPWYVTGVSDPAFDDDVLHELAAITGANLEVVDTSALVNGP
jgi:hypothetical protein